MERNEKMDLMIQNDVDSHGKLSNGEIAVLRSYNRTVQYFNSEHILIEDIVWENDHQEFLDTLRKYNVDKIVITNASTGLMNLIYFLVTNGCALEGGTIVKDKEEYGTYEKKGLIIKIN